ncbi:hypothetical protein DSM112329_02836 [Paraconexibacter sp. AEG42_29]|uniref:DNA mimic protein DMP19 C-terminal domain-containing protein n=1 Tax=Paraconexibacter sp. AEG42_29 TaxID=2997339 RepID=A0AAU7AWA4_9ACTN
MGVLLDAIYDACPDGEASPEHLGRLSPAHRAVFVVEWAMSEIYNGTLDQYFFNSAGDMAADLPAAARFLGADDYAAIFDDAVAFFDPSRITDRSYRQATLRQLEEAHRLDELGQVNDRIYELEDAGRIIYRQICDTSTTTAACSSATRRPIEARGRSFPERSMYRGPDQTQQVFVARW